MRGISSIALTLFTLTLFSASPAEADRRKIKNIIVLEDGSQILCFDRPAIRNRKAKVSCEANLVTKSGGLREVKWKLKYPEIEKLSNYSNRSRKLTFTPKGESLEIEVTAQIQFRGRAERDNIYVVSGKKPKKDNNTTTTTTTTTLPPTTTTTTTLPPPTTTTTSTTTTSTTTTTTIPNFGDGTALSNPNPVTTALTGSHATYNIGPGQTHTECGTVPFGALVAGDVVNIYHRSTPYKCKFGLRARATAAAKVYINGVTDAFGNRPILEFNGARTAAGSNPGSPNNVFSGTPEYGESLAGIIIKRGASDDWLSPKPSFIVIQNLELKNATNGNSYTTLTGATQQYDSSAGIWIQVGNDIEIKNNVITNNGFGVFTMAKDETLDHTAERPIIRNNRIYGNGVANSYLEHNLYIQATNPLVEGNYIGQVRTGSEGASYKSRSSGEIFRYNYVVSSSRALDFVHSEGNEDGIAAQPDYGTDYVYGNVIYNDCNLANCASNPIHYGGDNMGEQDESSSVFVPEIPYRSRLYFFGNTVINRADTSDSWRVSVFDLSLASTKVHAWNNIFANFGTSNFSWVDYAGELNLLGKNLVYGTMLNHHDFANPIHVHINIIGTLTTGNPKFVDLDSEDFSLQATSPALNLATGVPSGLPNNLAVHPILLQPNSGLNGLVTRTVTGAAPDLGALEHGVP